MPKIKNVSIERYYFNEINVRLHDGRIMSTDYVLEKNFGLILNNLIAQSAIKWLQDPKNVKKMEGIFSGYAEACKC